MKIANSIDRLRSTALVLGALAAVPMAAQAMVMDHEVSSEIEIFTGSSFVKRLPAGVEPELAARLGTYAGMAGNGANQVIVEPSDGNIHRQEDQFQRHLP